LKKKINQKNETREQSVNPDQIIDVPFEDAVRRLLQTPPIKKSKPQKKKA
jgi:hypothetical protein